MAAKSYQGPIKYPNRIVGGALAGTKITPVNGYAYILSIINGDPTNAAAVDFVDDVGLNSIKMGPSSSVSFMYPIKCKSFTVQDPDLSVIYYDGR